MVPAFLKIFALALVALLAPGGTPARAAPVELKAKVVWVRGDRVYVASAESLAVEVGDILRFRAGGKEIAAGTLIEARDEAMIVASLTSGSFRKQKKLEKVRVLAERPPLVRLTSLRVGCPSRSRPSLLFVCDGAGIGGAVSWIYRADTLSLRSYRFVRDPTRPILDPMVAQAAESWPDTLFVRAFDESADEEIALERGELDVAIFWPGELSTQIREDARWRGFLYGARAGLLGAKVREQGSFARLNPREAFQAFDLLNRMVFRGDLPPYSGITTWSASDETLSTAGQTPVRIEADPMLPGSLEINKALGQASGLSGQSSAGRVILVSYRQPRVNIGGHLDDARDRPDANWTVLSGIQCPVVTSEKLRATIRALGADVFADLAGCGLIYSGPR